MQAEERLVAELAQLGVNYLSRQNTETARVRAPQIVLAELVRQPSSRLRLALIPLLLARPQYSAYVPGVLKRLDPAEAQALKFFYTAAVYLQQRYTEILHTFLGTDWQLLPDLFTAELGVSGDSPAARLKALACIHAQWTGAQLNWAGTYDSAARHLLRRWEMERIWKQ